MWNICMRSHTAQDFTNPYCKQCGKLTIAYHYYKKVIIAGVLIKMSAVSLVKEANSLKCVVDLLMVPILAEN